MKIVLVIVIAIVIAGSGFVVWTMVNQPKDFLVRSPNYPLITAGDLTGRAVELNRQKVCLAGTFSSGFETSNLEVGGHNVWVGSMGSDESESLECPKTKNGEVSTCRSQTTICGTLYTKKGEQVLEEEKTNSNFSLLTGCCGHLSAYSYEIDGE